MSQVPALLRITSLHTTASPVTDILPILSNTCGQWVERENASLGRGGEVSSLS